MRALIRGLTVILPRMSRLHELTRWLERGGRDHPGYENSRSILYPRGAAVGAWVVRGLQRSAGIDQHRTGVTHHIRIGFIE